MSLTSIEGSLTIESRGVSLPPLSKQKASYQHEFPSPSGVFLEMNTMASGSGVLASPNETQTVESRPRSRLEGSASPDRGVDRMETIWEPYKNRYRILAASSAILGNGMNDAANGALIESLEK